MGVFAFIVMIVLISTIGKVLTQPRGQIHMQHPSPQLPPGEVDRIQETMHHLSERVARLEEERDFYKDLLDAPARPRGLSASGDDQAKNQ